MWFLIFAFKCNVYRYAAALSSCFLKGLLGRPESKATRAQDIAGWEDLEEMAPVNARSLAFLRDMESGADALALTFSVEEEEVVLQPPEAEDGGTLVTGRGEGGGGGGGGGSKAGAGAGAGAGLGGGGGGAGDVVDLTGTLASTLASTQTTTQAAPGPVHPTTRVVEAELVPGGSSRAVTDANKDEYVRLRLRHQLR
jgi:hypothetical protein